jgi:hypothetical protein
LEKRTSISQQDNVDPLDVLASALLPRLLPRLREELEREPMGLMSASETPTPRAVMAACRRGRIRGAKKIHRQWVFSVEAWREYASTYGEDPKRPSAPCVAASSEDDVIDELRRELGFIRKGART